MARGSCVRSSSPVGPASGWVASLWYKSYTIGMTPPTERSHRFNMMVSEKEHGMLTELADLRGVSAADVLRQLLREAHRVEFAAEYSAKKTATKGKK